MNGGSRAHVVYTHAHTTTGATILVLDRTNERDRDGRSAIDERRAAIADRCARAVRGGAPGRCRLVVCGLIFSGKNIISPTNSKAAHAPGRGGVGGPSCARVPERPGPRAAPAAHGGIPPNPRVEHFRSSGPQRPHGLRRALGIRQNNIFTRKNQTTNHKPAPPRCTAPNSPRAPVGDRRSPLIDRRSAVSVSFVRSVEDEDGCAGCCVVCMYVHDVSPTSTVHHSHDRAVICHHTTRACALTTRTLRRAPAASCRRRAAAAKADGRVCRG